MLACLLLEDSDIKNFKKPQTNESLVQSQYPEKSGYYDWAGDAQTSVSWAVLAA